MRGTERAGHRQVASELVADTSVDPVFTSYGDLFDDAEAQGGSAADLRQPQPHRGFGRHRGHTGQP